MIAPQPHVNEQERLKELESFSILRTLPETDYDNLTAIAAQICDTEISLVSLLEADCQWFKSHHGLALEETPRNISFCAHAINEPDGVFIVEDARKDTRFFDNPLVVGPPFIRFYAGVPLMSNNGLPLGTLCVVDTKPKTLSKQQLSALASLSNQVMNILNLRKSKSQLEEALRKLNEKNEELENFASVAAHDIKSPVAGISTMINFFLEQCGDNLDAEGVELMHLMQNSANQSLSLIDGLLANKRSDNTNQKAKTNVNLGGLEKDFRNLFSYEPHLNLTFKTNLESINANEIALKQVLINLITNAIKYNDKETIKIEVGIDSDSDCNYFYVKDNGPGIPKENQEKIFKIFEVSNSEDRYGKKGNGIGLATVKKIIEKSGGDISLKSKVGQGSQFSFTLTK